MENLINSIEKKFIQQCSERDSRSYEALYFSILEEFHVAATPRGVTSISRGRRRLAPKFASEILVEAPNFASKNIGDKYPKFFPLNFRFDPKIGIFPQLLHLVMTKLPKFFLLFGELGWTLPQILPPSLM